MYEYESYWINSTPTTNYQTLDEDIHVDCLVIGGGITGITTAFLLQKEGYKTALIEKNRICLGTTGHTTAKITSQHGLIYSHIVNLYGQELAKQYANANQQAIRFITEIVEKYHLECEFTKEPAYVYTQDEESVASINKELLAALSLGLPAEAVESIELPINIKTGIRFENQAQFHPRKYVLALAKLFTDLGGVLYEKTKAVKLDPKNKIVQTDNHAITAKHIVVATHYPCFTEGHMFFARMSPYTSYITGVRRNSILNSGMYINSDSHIHSFRYTNTKNYQLLLLGGESHKTGHGQDETLRYKALHDYADELYPDMSVAYNWSAQDYITIDYIPYIGLLSEDYEDIYVGTGYGKWGMTNGTAAALVIRDLIKHGSNPWQDVYSPSRHMTVDGFKNLVADSIMNAGNFISSHYKVNHKDIAHLEQGQGDILKLDHRKVAVYRDHHNKYYFLDPTCPHLKCVVTFNDAEKTWDCPCHGSRFNYDGTFIDGPANKRLKPLHVVIHHPHDSVKKDDYEEE